MGFSHFGYKDSKKMRIIFFFGHKSVFFTVETAKIPIYFFIFAPLSQSLPISKNQVTRNMKITKLNIKSFRGIPNECELSFVDRQGNPISSIIYGGNGSGKSSIVDAIEFCLQGKIERSNSLNNPQRPSTINFYVPKPEKDKPTTEITFEDGSTQKRLIFVLTDEETGNLRPSINNNELHSSFSISPIVLRRNDIISYNMTPESQRQLLMLQFMYNADITSKLKQDPEIMELDSKIIKYRHARDEVLQKIPTVIDIPINDLRLNSNNVEQLIRERFSPIGQKFGITSSGKIKKHIKVDVFNKALSIAEEYNRLSEKYKKIKSKRKNLVSIQTPDKFKELEKTFDEASSYLTSAFKEISNVNYIEDIRLSIANVSQTSLSISIKLVNGRTATPNKIFSEANYDLMILLLYLSLIRVSVNRGQEKVLILDDVLQSVDANIRANFIVYILKELKDWQLFITCHDRLWLNQLKYLFNNASHKYKEYHITNWSFASGPVIREVNLSSTDDTLKQAINTNNIRIMASMSGLFLEKICQELSISLNCSIERKVGDKYTIGDLWPSIKKSLKKTSLNPILEKIDKLLCIRNLLGCHYNEWAEAFADEEVQEFASSVQELYEKTYCSKCNNWMSKSRSKGINYECQCRQLQY